MGQTNIFSLDVQYYATFATNECNIDVADTVNDDVAATSATVAAYSTIVAVASPLIAVAPLVASICA